MRTARRSPDDRSRTMTALDAKIVAARAVGERRSPSRARRRHEPPRQGPDAARPQTRSRAWRSDCRTAPRSSQRPTARRRPPRWSRRCSSTPESRLVHNRAGANMAGGVASTLLAAARRGNAIDGELGLFEVDEFWLDRVAAQLRPRAMVLGNLFRDQLDRYGELDTIADRWAALAALDARHAAGAECGRSVDRGPRARARRGVTYFGVEDPSMAVAEMQHASDSKHCRRCGAAYVYDAVYLGHLGVYHCPSCGQRRPDPAVAARQIELDGTRGARFELATSAGSANVIAAAAGPLQRLQRARRHGALSRARLRARAGRDRARGGQRGIRPRRAGRARQAPSCRSC